jgi:uncharacterized protein
MFDSPLTIAMLFFSGLIAGTMDTIAGGGGLITIPVLFSFQWSPLEVFGTNKFQSTFGSFSATYHFWKAGKLRKRLLPGVLFTAAGALSGALVVGIVPALWLKKAIPFLLFAIAIVLFLAKGFGSKPTKQRMSASLFMAVFGLSIGFYDGFFGPGTGTFWAMAFVWALGKDLKEATASTKLMNFTSNIVPLAFFLFRGAVHFVPGIAMAAGQFIGGWIGTRLVLKRGAKFIRPVLILMALILAAKLLYDNWLR